MDRRICWILGLFIPPIVFLIPLVSTTFQNYVVASTVTDVISFGRIQISHFPNNQHLSKDADGNYTLNQDVLESDMSKTLLHTLFGNPPSWYQVCFKNINSTFYLDGHNTQLPLSLKFGFDNTDIAVPPQTDNCDNVITLNQKFSIKIYDMSNSSPSESTVSNFIKNDKEVLESVKENKIDASTLKGSFIPYISGEIDVRPYILTYVVGYAITFLVFAGIIFTGMETWKRISKKSL